MLSESTHKKFLNEVKRLGLDKSQVDFAKKMEVGEPIVSMYINGKRRVSRPFLKRFCEEYGISYEDMLKTDDAGQEKLSDRDLISMFLRVSDTQTLILKNIESKMAQQADQLTIKEKVQAVEARTEQIENTLGQMEDKSSLAANLNFVVATVKKLSKIQNEAVEDIRNDISRIESAQTRSSEGEHNSVGRTGGGDHKKGNRRAKRK